MGQHHALVCLDTKEALYAHPMGEGLKLLEQGAGGYGGTTTGFALLVAPGGPWHGKRVAVVGDYARSGDLAAGLPFADDPVRIYRAIEGDEGVHPFTDRVKAMVGETFGIGYEGAGWAQRTMDTARVARLAGSWGGHVITLGLPGAGMVDISEQAAAALERSGARDEAWAPWTLGALPYFLSGDR